MKPVPARLPSRRRHLRRFLYAAALVAAPAVAQDSAPAPDAPFCPEVSPGLAPGPGMPAAPPAVPAPVAEAPVPAPAPVPCMADPQPAPGTPKAGEPAAPKAPAPAQVTVPGTRIEGQQIEGPDPVTGVITVTGNPRAIRGTDEIRATRLLINPQTRQFTAEGDVVILRNGRQITGTRATYNFEDEEGQIENGVTDFNTYHLRSERIFLRPGGIFNAQRVRFTTCDQPNPHYDFYARTAQLIPGEQFVGRNVGIDLLGFRLITIPKYRKNLAEGEGQSLYPRFGYDSFHGPFAEKEFFLRRSNPVWLKANLQLNTFHEPQGGILAATPGRLQFVGALYYRDEAENQRSPHLEVSRLPELGVVWTPREVPRVGRFLPHQVAGVRYPERLENSRRWILGAEATGGFFRQHHGTRSNFESGESMNGARFLVQGQAVLPKLKLGPVSLNDLKFMARHSIYDTGDGYSVFGTGIGKKFTAGRWRFGVERLDQFTAGESPFLFDRVELKEEWRPEIEYRGNGFNASYYARIRGEGGLYDQVFAVSKLFHCIEPRFTYRVRRQQFFFEIRIPGLSGFHSTSPGEPNTVDTGDEGISRSSTVGDPGNTGKPKP